MELWFSKPSICDPCYQCLWPIWEPVSSARTGAFCFSYFPQGFPCGSAGKESACNAGDLGSIPELGRSPGEGKGYPRQYSGLENSMDCIVYGVTKSQTRLSDFHFTSLLTPTWHPSIPCDSVSCFQLESGNWIGIIKIFATWKPQLSARASLNQLGNEDAGPEQR